MAPALQVTLSCALSFGIPLLFAMHEMRAMRRPWHGPDDRDNGPGPAPTPPPPSDSPALKPLPACLIPNLPPAQPVTRERVLEPV